MGGPEVVIRYDGAKPPDRDTVKICAVAWLARGQLKKRPESKPGTAILESASAEALGVDAFCEYGPVVPAGRIRGTGTLME